ncbi:MAG: trehalose-phosphatase, partial [Candidatus Omnitrophica bacterium]|nr:trehalose-phosphatase [Candidatus Omnitrophota bacterium]
MDYLFDCWNKIEERLKGKHLFIFLDFDGTLTPIIDDPDKVRLSAQARKLLKALSERPGYKLAIISGRALKDIRKRAGLNNIVYAGNHGLEIEGPGVDFKSLLPPGYKLTKRRIKDELKRKISLIPGAFLEDKGASLSLHYRKVNKKQAPKIKTIFNETLKPYLAQGKVR